VSKTFLPVIRQRLCDQELQGIVEKISVSSKCKYYMYLTDSFNMQFYLCKPIPKLYQNFIAKYRLLSHSLSIETGRYHAKSDRKCPECKNDVEDEFHLC
jgi:hypothetical protein